MEAELRKFQGSLGNAILVGSEFVYYNSDMLKCSVVYFCVWSHLTLKCPFLLIKERKKEKTKIKPTFLICQYLVLLLVSFGWSFQIPPHLEGSSLPPFFTNMVWHNGGQRAPVFLFGGEKSSGWPVFSVHAVSWWCPWCLHSTGILQQGHSGSHGSPGFSSFPFPLSNRSRISVYAT